MRSTIISAFSFIELYNPENIGSQGIVPGRNVEDNPVVADVATVELLIVVIVADVVIVLGIWVEETVDEILLEELVAEMEELVDVGDPNCGSQGIAPIDCASVRRRHLKRYHVF